ncbi:hypothetical protein UFOVP816_8 [uncultured Caudovirales phage]|uniref:K1 capsule-specific polysaccharide lyase C-terminal domain-containing protein n=1 Tax=uncultured Caudovirales phage TaxID=2100421 RepID=A0A6J5NYU0_9CAUD|nr:hypothetical protein UFOVP816_8 [uncultured Caudovirales phage]
MVFQPGAMLNTQAFSNRPENLEVPTIQTRAPASTDINFPVGKWWLYTGNSLWYLLSQSSTGGSLSSNWVQISGSTGAVGSILGTANQITATTAAGVTTLSLPAALTVPGALTVTTNLNLPTGAAGIVGTTAAMTAGAITVNTTAVTASSIILVSHNTIAGTAGAVSAPAASRVAGTSFGIVSSSNTDTSTVNWLIIN